MRRRPVDNLTLQRWRLLDCRTVLGVLADTLKQDATFNPRECRETTRWHVSAGGFDYELLFTGPRYFDTRAARGGGGAVDLVMYLFQLDFKRATALLRDKGL